MATSPIERGRPRGVPTTDTIARRGAVDVDVTVPSTRDRRSGRLSPRTCDDKTTRPHRRARTRVCVGRECASPRGGVRRMNALGIAQVFMSVHAAVVQRDCL